MIAGRRWKYAKYALDPVGGRLAGIAVDSVFSAAANPVR
jgi:hypothetical protein